MECMASDEDGSLNPVLLMARSGAHGGKEQLRQLAGMRGLIARPSGEVIEMPITSSFREGLSVHEYFSSTHGRPQGTGRHGAEDLRGRPPDPTTGRRRAGRRRHAARLRHQARNPQGARMLGARVRLKSGKLIDEQTGARTVRSAAR